MDLSTNYLGLTLEHPLMPGASPLCDTLDGCKRLEDAGASALVLRSLFEEQITREELGLVHDLLVDEAPTRSRCENSLSPPIFRSPRTATSSTSGESKPPSRPCHRVAQRHGARGLAGVRPADRTGGCRRLELNVYHVRSTRGIGLDVERRLLNVVRQVKWWVDLRSR